MLGTPRDGVLGHADRPASADDEVRRREEVRHVVTVIEHFVGYLGPVIPVQDHRIVVEAGQVHDLPAVGELFQLRQQLADCLVDPRRAARRPRD